MGNLNKENVNNQLDRETIKANDLARIKKNIAAHFDYFVENNKRYHELKKYFLVTSLSNEQKESLIKINKPPLEFPLGDPFISRELGEYAKQTPSIKITQNSTDKESLTISKLIEEHYRYISYESEQECAQYDSYKDQISGGFAALEIAVESETEGNLNKKIVTKKIKDPTMVGFDPAANKKDKRDGRFCFKIVIISKDDAIDYGIDTEGLNFNSSFSGAQLGATYWSYKNQSGEYLAYVFYYEKKKTLEKVVRLVTGEQMKLKEYKEIGGDYSKYMAWKIKKGKFGKNKGDLESIFLMNNPIAIVPPIHGEPEEVVFTRIVKYELVENKIIKGPEELPPCWDFLPMIFVDGNSEVFRDDATGEEQQYTKPLLHSLKGLQSFRNSAGQTIAQYIFYMTQQKFFIAQETITGLNDKLLKNYRDSLGSSHIFWKAYDDTTKAPLPKPEVIPRSSLPGEVLGVFNMSNQSAQSMLGTYNIANIDQSGGPMSGNAIVQGAAQSNSAAKPYLYNNVKAWDYVAKMILKLMPTYKCSPSRLPIQNMDGGVDYQKINHLDDEESIYFDFDPNDYSIEVSMGANTAIQKEMSLREIERYSNSIPSVREFFATDPRVVPIIMDNLEVRGSGELKSYAKEWVAKKEEQSRQPMPPDPQSQALAIEAKKVQISEQNSKVDAAIKAGQLKLDAYSNETDRGKLVLDAKQANEDNQVREDKYNAEKIRAMADLAIKTVSMHHSHNKDAIDYAIKKTIQKPLE